MIFKTFVLSLLYLTLIKAVPIKINNFERTEVLSPKYSLTWKVDFDINRVTFEVKAETTGFVGFGISSNGNMMGSDIVIGGVDDNGVTYFEDRHGVGYVVPEIDEHQDWTLNWATQEGNFTSLSFYRQFDNCDGSNDVGINNDTQYIIWSIGKTDTLEHHLDRGAKAVNFLDPPSPPLDISQLQKFRIEVNSAVSSEKDTMYWCTAHKTTVKNKVQIIGFEVLLETELAKKYVHHLILHKCTGANIGNIIDPFLGGPGGECYLNSDPIYSLITHCNTYFYVWARGGDRLLLPEHVGLPVGENGGEEYYLVEVHYDNPNLDQDIYFQTGVTLFLATDDDLREYDAGLLHVGHEVAPSLTVPPNVIDFTAVGHCSSECTKQFFPKDGLKIFNTLLHSHLNGRRLTLRHFRDSEELPWIAYDNNYDFNYQQNRALRTEVTILPGDHLSYECTYDTTWEKPPSATHGGLSTRHEMCETFILYYPLVKTIDVCQSEISTYSSLLQGFGIQGIRMQDPDTPIVTAPAALKGLTYEQVLNTHVNWTSDFLAEIQQTLRFSDHMGSCQSHLNSKGQINKYQGITKYPEIREPYQPPEPNCGPRN